MREELEGLKKRRFSLIYWVGSIPNKSGAPSSLLIRSLRYWALLAEQKELNIFQGQLAPL
jgi:hypothetical protein